MIYFSIDNDHQTGLVLSLIDKLGIPKDGAIIISHKSARNVIAATSGVPCCLVDIHPLCSGLGYKNYKIYWKSFVHQLTLRKLFQFKSEDVLVVTTEYELNNAFFAKQMRQSGGGVYLFDEGIGFYFNNSPFHDNQTSLRDKIFLSLYNLAFSVLGIPAHAKKGFEGRMYVHIKNVFIDRIYSRMRLPVNRPEPIYGYRNFLASEQSKKPKNEGAAIFFANNLSCFGLKDQELLISGDAVRQMASKFDEVHLKIHPADWVEKNVIFDFYMKLVSEHANIHLIDNSMTGNEAIEHVRPLIVVGTLGAAMFDAFFFGCHPIFLFQLLPPIAEFGVCRYTLESMGYRYVRGLNDIGPDYQCGVDVNALLYEDELIGLQQQPDHTADAAFKLNTNLVSCSKT
jgi:hypothetical protein